MRRRLGNPRFTIYLKHWIRMPILLQRISTGSEWSLGLRSWPETHMRPCPGLTFRRCTPVLTGERAAPAAATALEKQLVEITGFKTGPPPVGGSIRYSEF